MIPEQVQALAAWLQLMIDPPDGSLASSIDINTWNPETKRTMSVIHAAVQDGRLTIAVVETESAEEWEGVCPHGVAHVLICNRCEWAADGWCRCGHEPGAHAAHGSGEPVPCRAHGADGERCGCVGFDAEKPLALVGRMGSDFRTAREQYEAMKPDERRQLIATMTADFSKHRIGPRCICVHVDATQGKPNGMGPPSYPTFYRYDAKCPEHGDNWTDRLPGDDGFVPFGAAVTFRPNDDDE